MGQKCIFLFPDRTRRLVYPIRQNLAGWGWSLGTSQGTQGKAVGPAVDCDPLFFFFFLPPVDGGMFFGGSWRFGAGCWLQLYFLCLLDFLFLKTVACTLFCHSLCGDGTLNFCLEKCNNFTLFCLLFQQLFDVSVLWLSPQLFDHSNIHSVVLFH